MRPRSPRTRPRRLGPDDDAVNVTWHLEGWTLLEDARGPRPHPAHGPRRPRPRRAGAGTVAAAAQRGAGALPGVHQRRATPELARGPDPVAGGPGPRHRQRGPRLTLYRYRRCRAPNGRQLAAQPQPQRRS